MEAAGISLSKNKVGEEGRETDRRQVAQEIGAKRHGDHVQHLASNAR